MEQLMLWNKVLQHWHPWQTTHERRGESLRVVLLWKRQTDEPAGRASVGSTQLPEHGTQSLIHDVRERAWKPEQDSEMPSQEDTGDAESLGMLPWW